MNGTGKGHQMKPTLTLLTALLLAPLAVLPAKSLEGVSETRPAAGERAGRERATACAYPASKFSIITSPAPPQYSR